MITVRYLNPPPWIIRLFGDETGRVFLDLSEDFEAELTKAIDDVSDFDSVSQEAALPGGIPSTPRNKAIADQFRGEAFERNQQSIKIEVRVNGERIPLTAAVITAERSQDNEFEIDMFAADWIDDLKSVRLNELSIGSYAWTFEQIVQSWEGDRREIVKPTPAFYGAWTNEGQVSPEDLRIWFNLGELLRRTFLSIGWSLNCPHLFDADGRHIYGYLSGSDWFSYSTKRTPYFVELEIPEQSKGSDLFTAIQFNEVIDTFDQFNRLDGILIAPDEFQYLEVLDREPGRLSVELIDVEVEIPGPVNGELSSVTFVVVKDNDEVLFQRDYLGSPNGPSTIRVSEVIVDDNASRLDRYYFGIQSFTPGGPNANVELKGGRVYFRPDPPSYNLGDSIPLAELIDEELTGMDLLSAVAHLMNGKVTTDPGSKTVSLRPAYGYFSDEAGINVEGFFLPGAAAVDLREQTSGDQISWETEEAERDRFLRLGFQDPSDEYVDQIDGGDRYEREIDRGSGVAETTEIENPLFGPTYGRRIEGEAIGGNGAFLPVLQDNDDGSFSTDVGYRVGVWYGEVPQTVGPDPSSFVFNEATRTSIPFMSQTGPGSLPFGISRIPLVFKGYTNDLWERHYRREVQIDDSPVTYEIQASGGGDTYLSVDFRSPILVRGESSDFLVRPVAVSGYRWGTTDRIPIIAKPFR